MIRYFLATLIAGLLPLAAASGQSEELGAAIDAYLEEDYGHIDIIARYADEGVPEAIAVLGQAYLYGYGIEIDRPLGVALLEQAGSLGERSSLVHLGRVFEFGVEGIPADPETAADWYVKAARAGDTASAPAALQRLPAEAVIAAGGAAWANTSTGTDSASSPETQKPSGPPGAASAKAQKDAAKIVSPASAILGTSKAPPPLVMNDKTDFPIFSDTRLSPVGEAAASCLVVLQPEIERKKRALEDLMKLDGTSQQSEQTSRYTQLADNDRQLTAMNEALRASKSILADPTRNGGLNADAVQLALMPHRDALASRPASGPTASLCGQRLVQLVGESAGWTAR